MRGGYLNPDPPPKELGCCAVCGRPVHPSSWYDRVGEKLYHGGCAGKRVPGWHKGDQFVLKRPLAELSAQNDMDGQGSVTGFSCGMILGRYGTRQICIYPDDLIRAGGDEG